VTKHARKIAPQRGLTLIELMLVLVIIAALGGIVIPQFAGTRARFELDADARALLAMSRRARMVAVTEGRGCRLAIDPAARSYRLVRDADPLADPEDYVDPADEQPRFREAGTLGESTVVTLTDLQTGDAASSSSSYSADLYADAEMVVAELIGTDQPFEILFRPDGTAQAAEVLLQEADGNASWTLVVRAATGQAKIYRTAELEQLDASGAPR